MPQVRWHWVTSRTQLKSPGNTLRSWSGRPYGPSDQEVVAHALLHVGEFALVSRIDGEIGLEAVGQPIQRQGIAADEELVAWVRPSARIGVDVDLDRGGGSLSSTSAGFVAAQARANYDHASQVW